MSKKDTIIERLAILEEKTGKSANTLGKEAGLGNGTVDRWKDNQLADPNLHAKQFLKHHNINPKWWETGKGEVFLTSVQERSDNTGKQWLDFSPEDVYRKIIEGGTEYLLVPKTAFEGHYRFVPIEQIQSQTRELERRDHQIEGLYEIIKLIASGRPIDFSKIQDAEKNAGVGDTGA